MTNLTWWQTAVFYQIYPRSFADGNGDCIGDFLGMSERLDYLADLVRPDRFFGELALLDDGLRTASVIASEPTQCLALTRWDFLSVLRENDMEM